MNKLKNNFLLILLGIFLSSTGIAHRLLITDLNGAEEVPGPGDDDGFGKAILVLKPHHEKICFVLFVGNIGAATAAHIHEGAEGSAGPIVVTLETPADGTSGDCIDGIDQDLINAIIDNPAEYYVNVHNDEFPSGALRGQLGVSSGDDDDDDANEDEEDENQENDDDDLCHAA